MSPHEVKTCPVCSKDVPASKGNRPRIFCSVKCGKDYHNARYNTAEHHLFFNAKSRAKTRGLEFTLRKEDIIVPDVCPILGIKLSRGAGPRGYIDNSPSLDRIDNRRGYTPDNIQVLSMRANRLKNDSSPCELAAILAHLKHQGAECVPSKDATHQGTDLG